MVLYHEKDKREQKEKEINEVMGMFCQSALYNTSPCACFCASITTIVHYQSTFLHMKLLTLGTLIKDA